jgi:hypothetical protein
MLIMYRGFELVPIKDGEKWQAQSLLGWPTNYDNDVLCL